MSGKDIVTNEEIWLPKSSKGTLGGGEAVTIDGGFADLTSLEEVFNIYNDAAGGLSESTRSIRFLLEGAIARATTKAQAIEEETERKKASIISEARLLATKTIEEAENLAEATVADAHNQAKQALHRAEKNSKLLTVKALQDINGLMDKMRESLDGTLTEGSVMDDLDPSEDMVADAEVLAEEVLAEEVLAEEVLVG